MNLNDRFANLKSDFSCKDYKSIATRIDLEFVAGECIRNGRNPEGCNLLIGYGRLLTCNNNRLDQELQEMSYRLDQAKDVLGVIS